jgi:AcrR family transcriptional regulator
MPEQPYHHGNLRAALVDAGRALLEEQGLAALSLRAIAGRVGVSHAAPRNHFGTLRCLLTTIATEGFLAHAAALQVSLAEARGAAARRAAILDAYVDFATARPQLFQLMFSKLHIDFGDPSLRKAAGASYAVLQAAAAPPGTAPKDRVKAEMHLWALAHGYAVLASAGFFGPEAQGDRRHAASALLTANGCA